MGRFRPEEPLSGGMISNMITNIMEDLGVDRKLIKKINLLAGNLLENIDVEKKESENETIFTIHLNKINVKFKK